MNKVITDVLQVVNGTKLELIMGLVAWLGLGAVLFGGLWLLFTANKLKGAKPTIKLTLKTKIKRIGIGVAAGAIVFIGGWSTTMVIRHQADQTIATLSKTFPVSTVIQSGEHKYLYLGAITPNPDKTVTQRPDFEIIDHGKKIKRITHNVNVKVDHQKTITTKKEFTNLRNGE